MPSPMANQDHRMWSLPVSLNPFSALFPIPESSQALPVCHFPSDMPMTTPIPFASLALCPHKPKSTQMSPSLIKFYEPHSRLE